MLHVDYFPRNVMTAAPAEHEGGFETFAIQEGRLPQRVANALSHGKANIVL